MARPPVSLVLAAAGLAPAGCSTGDGDGVTTVVAVEVAAQPCTTPNRRLGIGMFVDDGLVLTAAHVVDGDVRAVTVDGRPAAVVAVDARLDAALVATASPPGVQPVALATGADLASTGAGAVVTPSASFTAQVGRLVDLTVDDVTDGVEHRRRAVVVDAAVPPGTSGAPVVDTRGRVVGMVAITDRGAAETYATAAPELAVFVERHAVDQVANQDAGRDRVPDAGRSCP